MGSRATLSFDNINSLNAWTKAMESERYGVGEKGKLCGCYMIMTTYMVTLCKRAGAVADDHEDFVSMPVTTKSQ